MKTSLRAQRGATAITWMIVAAVGIMIVSAGVKVGPYYLEYNSVKGLMENIAAEPGIERASKREVLARVERYLNVNNLDSLSKAHYASKKSGSKVDAPFRLVKLKRDNARELAVNYEVKSPWMGNLSFLMDYNYAVTLGQGK